MVLPPRAGADETVTVARIAFCLKKSESPAFHKAPNLARRIKSEWRPQSQAPPPRCHTSRRGRLDKQPLRPEAPEACPALRCPRFCNLTDTPFSSKGITESETTIVTREHCAGGLIGDGAVRQFFPALRDERFPLEFQGFLRIAGCDIRKVGNVTRLGGLRPVHEREP